jgi:hypothetical protein
MPTMIIKVIASAMTATIKKNCPQIAGLFASQYQYNIIHDNITTVTHGKTY